jgi:hypothetical protein
MEPIADRSARRATARRASSRRATARELKHDIRSDVADYVDHHPDCTIGDIAKGLNAERATVARWRP